MLSFVIALFTAGKPAMKCRLRVSSCGAPPSPGLLHQAPRHVPASPVSAAGISGSVPSLTSAGWVCSDSKTSRRDVQWTTGFEAQLIILSWRAIFKSHQSGVPGLVCMGGGFPREPVSVGRELS